MDETVGAGRYGPCMRPAPQTVDVWLGEASGDGACCTAAEHERAALHRDPGAAKRWLGARQLLRQVLAGAIGVAPADVVLETYPGGKPIVPGSGLHVNLSHSGGLVAVALAGPDVGAVGIDIEMPRTLQRPERLAQRLSPWPPGDGEHAREPATSGPPDTAELLRRWTRMEALVKATGEGVSGGISGAESRITARGWSVRELAVPRGGVGAVAAYGHAWRVVVHPQTQSSC